MRSSMSCVVRLGLNCKICGRCTNIFRAQFIPTHYNHLPGEIICSDCLAQNNYDRILEELERR
jgi:hypothetical protein